MDASESEQASPIHVDTFDDVGSAPMMTEYRGIQQGRPLEPVGVEVDVDSYAVTLKQQTEETIELMHKMANAAGRLKDAQQKLQTELTSEHRQRAEAENLARTFQCKTEELSTKTEHLQQEVYQLAEAVAEKEQIAQKAMKDKEITLAKLSSDISSQEALMKGLRYMWGNIDAFRLGEGVLQEPCGACMLPDGCVVVADTLQGLLLFSAQTELIRQVTSPDWKWPQGLVYDTDNSLILVSLAKKYDDGTWRRVIAYFDLHLEWVRSIEGPSDGYIDEHVAKERVCMAPNGELYMSLCDKIGSAIYKYSAGQGAGVYNHFQWFQLTKRNGASFIDCQVLAVLGPITEILVVEQRMGYIHRLSIRNDEIVDRKSMAIVERPGAVCVDEKRQLFVHDILSGKVRQVDTLTWEPMRDVCVTDEGVFTITASHGYLGVALRDSKLVKVHRYVSSAI